MQPTPARDVWQRAQERISDWRIDVERRWETESSLIVMGRRDGQHVVLKVVREVADEWRSGEVLETFGGNGVVRAYERAEGAVLLERLSPGHQLVDLVLAGRDDRATEIIADLIAKTAPRSPPQWVPAAAQWGESLERYAASGDGRVPKHILSEAHQLYRELCRSQSQPRLLHGDLHHYNVIFDAHRGWVAVDPKGVVGELEYELGAALRNPFERTELHIQPSTIERRVECFAARLHVDIGRTLAWAFAQAVLAGVWAIEDGRHAWHGRPWLSVAEAIRPMLNRWGWR